MKKTFLLICIFTVFFISITPINKASAFTPVAARIAAGSAGERVVLGLMEKAGMNISTKAARKKAMERFELEAYENLEFYKSIGDVEKHDQLSNFYNQLANLTDNQLVPIKSKDNWTPGDFIEIPEKPNFGKYIVSGVAFLTGVDLILDVYDDIKQAYNEQSNLERIKEFGEELNTGEMFSVYKGVKGYIRVDQNQNTYLQIGNPALSYPNYIAVGNKIDTSKPWSVIFEVTGDSGNVLTISYKATAMYLTGSSLNKSSTSNVSYVQPTEDFNRVVSVPTADMVPVKNTDLDWVNELQNTGNVSKTVPDVVAVDIPLTDDYQDPMDNPWNEPESLENGDSGSGSGTPNPTEPGSDIPTKKPEDEANKWSQLVTTQFPFSLPWDIAYLIGLLNAPPEAPVFEVAENLDVMGMQVPFEFKHTIEWIEPYIGFFRTIIVIGYCFMLVFATSKLLGGAK